MFGIGARILGLNIILSTILHISMYLFILFYHYVLSYYIPISYNNEIAKVEKMLLMLFSTHRMELFTEIHLVVFNLKS